MENQAVGGDSLAVASTSCETAGETNRKSPNLMDLPCEIIQKILLAVDPKCKHDVSRISATCKKMLSICKETKFSGLPGWVRTDWNRCSQCLISLLTTVKHSWWYSCTTEEEDDNYFEWDHGESMAFDLLGVFTMGRQRARQLIEALNIE